MPYIWELKQYIRWKLSAVRFIEDEMKYLQREHNGRKN